MIYGGESVPSVHFPSSRSPQTFYVAIRKMAGGKGDNLPGLEDVHTPPGNENSNISVGFASLDPRA